MQDIHAYLNNDVQTTQILTSSLVAQKATRVQVYRSSGNDAETGFTDEVNAPARLVEIVARFDPVKQKTQEGEDSTRFDLVSLVSSRNYKPRVGDLWKFSSVNRRNPVYMHVVSLDSNNKDVYLNYGK